MEDLHQQDHQQQPQQEEQQLAEQQLPETSEIQRLDDETVRRITAEQAISDLTSIVKELIDNALDAESTTINSECFVAALVIVMVIVIVVVVFAITITITIVIASIIYRSFARSFLPLHWIELNSVQFYSGSNRTTPHRTTPHHTISHTQSGCMDRDSRSSRFRTMETAFRWDPFLTWQRGTQPPRSSASKTFTRERD